MVESPLARGRQAFAERGWARAHAALRVAAEAGPLGAADVELLARAAHLAGDDDAAASAWGAAHRAWLAEGAHARAARAAFWTGFTLADRGEAAQAAAWFARAGRTLDGAGSDGSEVATARAYLEIPGGLQCLGAGDFDGAEAAFTRAAAAGEQAADADLATIGRLGVGQARLARGDPRGMAQLDDAMLSVVSGEVRTAVAGLVYCAVIDACHRAFDLRRAREWTEALTTWCDEQPELVPYRGQCLVHRSELLQLHDRGAEALAAAEAAVEHLSAPRPQPAVGDAWYQLAELHRERGALADAERGYDEACRHGRDPQPGLAQLRLRQGAIGAALAAVRRVLGEAQDAAGRARLLGPAVEVLLAGGAVAEARAAADELHGLAVALGADALHARADAAQGAVLLAAGEPGAALDRLSEARRRWHEVGAPAEVARCAALTAAAHRALGDEDTAAVAEATGTVGAGPPDGDPTPLTVRELEVLREVAAGCTNKEVAAALGISPRTVDRHLSNTFTKLGVGTRTAAVAWAFEHGLLDGTRG